MKPVIALTPLIDQNLDDSPWMLKEYFRAIEKAGGIPVMLAPLKDKDDIDRMAAMFDGILFTGGQDVDPAIYGREKEVDCDIWISKDRDVLEQPLLRRALEADLPILGICRGLQFINAVLGGTLWQDLPSQRPEGMKHSQEKPYCKPCHQVTVVKDTPLYDMVGKDTIGVTSLHHQAIRDLAPGLRVMATSPDGLVEAFDMPSARFLWAVQWHPEYMFDIDEDSFGIFKAFVDVCR